MKFWESALSQQVPQNRISQPRFDDVFPVLDFRKFHEEFPSKNLLQLRPCCCHLFGFVGSDVGRVAKVLMRLECWKIRKAYCPLLIGPHMNCPNRS